MPNITPIGNRQLAIGNDLACVLHRLSPLLEHFAVPHKARARIGGELEVLRQLQTRSGTGFLAERAEHAARSIEDKLVEHFLLTRLARHDDLDVHRDYVDTVFRTGNRAKITGDTKRVVRFRIHVQARRAMKTRRHVGTDFRILLGVNSLARNGVFINERAEIVFQRKREPSDEVDHEEAFELLAKCRFWSRY
jgi:hypothetical protein